jgi:hypothetical protein
MSQRFAAPNSTLVPSALHQVVNLHQGTARGQQGLAPQVKERRSPLRLGARSPCHQLYVQQPISRANSEPLLRAAQHLVAEPIVEPARDSRCVDRTADLLAVLHTGCRCSLLLQNRPATSEHRGRLPRPGLAGSGSASCHILPSQSSTSFFAWSLAYP